MTPPLTDEHVRILVAIDENRLTVNKHGRYEIDGEERPDRRSREQLRSRGLIEHAYEYGGRGSYWRLKTKGKTALKHEMARRVAETRATVNQLQAEGMSFPDAYTKAVKA